MHASEGWTIAFAGGTLDRAAHLRTDEAAGELRRFGRARAVLVGEGQSVAPHGSSALAGHRRRCPNCGLRSFPRTDPVVTMVIESGDRALLTRRRGAVGTTWSAVAGFIEPGETPEEALVREAQEEVGVAIARVQYVGAQPWPFPHALMLGYRAIADGDQAPARVRDTDELAGARWFTRAQLRRELAAGTIALPPAIAIGRRLIADWLDRG